MVPYANFRTQPTIPVISISLAPSFGGLGVVGGNSWFGYESVSRIGFISILMLGSA